MNLLLKELRWYSTAGEGRGDIRIARGRIRETGRGLRRLPDEHVLELGDHVAVPGLINAHDHLGLNLFPRRGHPPYSNFYAWARDLHRPDDDQRHEVMSVPLRDRLWWGAYKNLIAGVTTVAHHDPYVGSVFGRLFPVQVLRRYGWAHSLGFGRHVRWKARCARFLRRPFMIHAAEGVDEASSGEINQLTSMGVLASNTVLIHAVALGPRQIDVITDAGCAVVWCPVSNQFLFHASAPISALQRRGVPVALGTDSTLSGSPTLLHELRRALEYGSAGEEELFAMVTADAARILRLNDGRGILCEGGRADLAVFPDTSSAAVRAIFDAPPALVIVRGHVRLARSDVAERLGLGPPSLTLEGTPAWIYGDLDGLRRRIADRVGHATLRQHPLWVLLADPAPVGTPELDAAPIP